jgi:titin
VFAKNAVGWTDRVEIRATPVAEPTVAPGGLTASVAPAPGATSGEVKLTWDAAAASGAGVTDYAIESSADGTTWTRVDDGVSTNTSSTVGGLINGTPYWFRVAAANQFGAGPFSGKVHATPVWMPASPELTAVTAPADGVRSGEVQLSWSVPADNGLAISDYVIEGSVDGDTWTALDDGVSTATAYTVGGLHDGTEYLFRVSAVNDLGQGQPSVATTATPTWTPAAPSRLSAAVAPADGLGSGQVGLTWTSPVDHGSAITDYVIEESTDGTTWTVVDDGVGPTASATVSGLVDGVSVWLRLAALNAIGRSEWSVPIETTPLGPPDVPGGLDAAAAAGQVGLTWTAPSATGGSMITDYIVQQSTDGTTWTTVSDGVSTATETTVSGLTNGTGYEFRVAAVNVVGAGPWSSAVQTTPAGTPEPPSALLATAGAGRARLTWTAPDSNGSPLTDYIVQRSTDGATWTTIRDGVSTATATTVSGLTNGTRYQFRVAAANGVGAGPWSSPVQATPVAKPGRPSALRATAGVGRVRLTWTAAASNGSPITDYIVQRAIGRRWITVNDGVRTAPSATVTGLTNGTSYRFRVAAKNAVGQGAWSAAVRAIPHAR